MPSIRARLATYYISYKFGARRTATWQQILEGIRDGWAAENAPEVVPTAAEESFKGSLEEWQVFHMRPRGEPVEKAKVVVYWHGGERVHQTSKHPSRRRSTADPSSAQAQDRHWIFAQKLADELKCDVVFPIYTLAPLATGTSCITTCLELLAHLRNDTRYAGKEVVLAGDSAGGWIALRTLLALVERSVGKTTFRNEQGEVTVEDFKVDGDKSDYKAIIDCVSDVLMISPVVDTRADRPEDLEAAERDPWLSKDLVDTMSLIWNYGPAHAFPDFDFNVPADKVARPIVTDASELPPLDHQAFAPINGLDVIREYKDFERIRLTTFIGTSDILCPSNKRMQARLEALGVKSDLHVYDGLFHVFPLLPWLPESMDAFEKIRKLF
ncbi:hypothetical protein NliqN6_2717 [Naganishia liquefaciens]|uniref:Alpha/beta hydrolase fold-3 domain-containing protein n=1 Tax=Naganishia liquefaciens TaxID=104408 RepID=A0A8H3TSB7_9TREE|nr:hypothetical protein NliqN6_2717 [Naganishia liquefaciens]